MVSTRQQLVRSLLTLLVLLTIGVLGFSRQFYTEALDDAFFSLALASVAILHQRVRPSWLDAAWMAAGAIALESSTFASSTTPTRSWHGFRSWY